MSGCAGDGDGEAGEGAAEPPKDKTRPIVMVHVHPGGVTAAQAAHDASEEILDLFEKHGVPRGRLTVEWGEQYVRMWGSHTNYIEIRDCSVVNAICV